MIHNLLFRLRNPGLYHAVKALKTLRALLHACPGQALPGRHRLSKAKTTLYAIHQKARDNSCRSMHLRLIDYIIQLLEHFEKCFQTISDYNFVNTREVGWFFTEYLSLLDLLAQAVTGSPSKLKEAAARAGALAADTRKTLRSFRLDSLSRTDGFYAGKEFLTLLGDFDLLLTETERLLARIASVKLTKIVSC